MAQDINKFIEKLGNAAKEMDKLKNDNILIDAINTLMNLADEAGGFGGEIARVIPSNLHVYSESLTGVYKTLKASAENAEAGVNRLVEYLDSMPIGSIRKKQFTPAAAEGGEESTNATPAATEPLDLTPDTSNGPKSAVVQESMEEPASLRDFYDRDFNNITHTVFNESRESSPFDFSRISEDLDESGKTFDLGELNSVGRQKLSESFYQDYEEQDSVSMDEHISGLKKRITERKEENAHKTLDFNQLAREVPNVELGSLNESMGNGKISMLDTPENMTDKSFSYSGKGAASSPSDINIDLSDMDMNIVED